MFHALVTVFAGYWRPSLPTRLWVILFFLIVRLQGWLHFAAPFAQAEGKRSTIPGSSAPSA